ncbi:MAG TPA: NrfD/PsrC family molybdoenzyme membrane anchor subunit [Fimbriimonadales bacterium]|nr:NrfD/PsrC family molybdoenzyme membrane anchor subunit [Fimbriimonadales bacterium]
MFLDFANGLAQVAGSKGYVYPNEAELHWSILIVIYPYLTGLVAGAFILASLVRVFNVEAVRPTYRLSLLTALAFLIVAPFPLIAHLGHPERAFEIMITPHLSSAMAVFGFVYLWYLMVVLLLEIWFDYRKDIVLIAKSSKGFKKIFYSILTLGVMDISEDALRFDDKAGRIITIIGIPSAILLHGYVGFIFGSLKANPWWSSVAMPVIFLLSAIVSGVALVTVLYFITSWWRKHPLDMKCLDTMGKFLMYALIVDFASELLDGVHRLYEAGEWFSILTLLASGYLYQTIFIMQLFLGTLVPLAALAWLQFFRTSERTRKGVYFFGSILVLIGVFFMRWNVVIGGQLFSKSLHGLTTYKLELVGREGGAVAMVIMLLPFLLLWILARVLPPWETTSRHEPTLAKNVA